MATAEEYAQWIVDNADKKGTPEFETVAQAYQAARAGGTGGGWLASLEKKAANIAHSAAPAVEGFGRGASMLARGAAQVVPGAVAGGALAGPLGAIAGSLIVPAADAAAAAYNYGAGKAGWPQVEQPSAGINRLLTKAGLPEPQTMPERAMVGAGGALGGVGATVPAATKLATSGATQVARGVGEALASRPVAQTLAAPAMAATGQVVGETTDNPALGFGAALATGAALGRMGGREPIPTRAQLAAKAGEQYGVAERAGVVVAGQPIRDLARDIGQQLRADGYTEKMPFQKLTAALSELNDTAATGKPQTLNELEVLRRRASIAAGSVDRAEARLGSKLVDMIDDFVDGLDAKQLAAAPNGNVDNAVSALNKARELWTRNRKAETIETAIYRADNSPSDPETALRAAFRAISNDPKRMRSFNEQERAAILDVVRGTNIQRGLRKIAEFTPNMTNVLAGSALGGYLGSQLGPVASVLGASVAPAAGLLGAGARSAVSGATVKNAANVNDMVRLGRPPRAAFAPVLPLRGALAGLDQQEEPRKNLNAQLRAAYGR